MRITDNLRMHDISRNLNQIRNLQAEAARKAASGLRVDAPSKDPLGAARATQLNSALEQIGSQKTNVQIAISDVDLTEASIAQGSELLNRARELAMQGSNGSYTAKDRLMFADEIAALRGELIAVANTKGSYGYLFAGHQTDAPAFDSDGNYQGDSGAHQVEVGRGAVLQSNQLGDTVFKGSGGGTDIFASLDALEQAFRNNDPSSVAAGLTTIDASMAQLDQARASAGLTRNRLDIASQSLERSELSFTTQRSETVEADPFASLSELSNLGNTLEQAISVARTLLSSNSNNRF